MGPPFVIALRLVVPVLILRWPLAGIVAGIAVDTLDVVILAVLRSGSVSNYTEFDKLLDTYMLAFAVFVSLRWDNRTARYTSIALFLYRVVGVVILLVTDTRWVLFLFPNVFQFFFIYHLVTVRWLPHLEMDGYRRMAIVLPVLVAMTLVQEYILHVAQYQPWYWLHIQTLQLRSEILERIHPFYRAIAEKIGVTL